MAFRTICDFGELSQAWDALHDRAPAASLFNTWDWQHEWWKVYGHGRPLRILVAERAGVVTGILPLYLDRVRRCGVPVTVARLVGMGGDTYPDDLGPVVEDRETAHALAQAALRLDEAQVLDLQDLDPRTGFADAMAAAAAASGWRAARERAQRIPYIELPATWDAYLASVSAGRRAGIRKVRRKLAAEATTVRFHLWGDPGTLDRGLERIATLHRRRWQAAGQESGSFATSRYLAFHRAVMAAMARRGALRLYCLDLDGETVAMLYACRFRNGIYVVQAGFDPAHARRRVGKALLDYAIEHAIGEGNEVFDFLRGEHAYKDQIATSSRETASVTLRRPGLRASAWRLRERALPRWKRRLKALLRRG